jgi:hypothetical protein
MGRFIDPPIIVVVGLLLINTAAHRSPTRLSSRSSGIRMGFSPTFQILSRYGIVLRELQGSTDPVRLRAEEMLIPNSALGNRAGLLPQNHGLVSVIAGNLHMILRWTEGGCVDFRCRLRATCSGERTE